MGQIAIYVTIITKTVFSNTNIPIYALGFHLNNLNRECRGLHVSLASEGLSTSLNINQVQAGAEALVLDKVGEVLKHITREAINGGLGHEAVNGHLAVGPAPNLEGDSIDGDRANRRAGGGDRASITQGSEPDHNLIFLASVGGGAEEHVVGDVSNHVGVGVAS